MIEKANQILKESEGSAYSTEVRIRLVKLHTPFDFVRKEQESVNMFGKLVMLIKKV